MLHENNGSKNHARGAAPLAPRTQTYTSPKENLKAVEQNRNSSLSLVKSQLSKGKKQTKGNPPFNP
jgi:hypothetical protein